MKSAQSPIRDACATEHRHIHLNCRRQSPAQILLSPTRSSTETSPPDERPSMMPAIVYQSRTPRRRTRRSQTCNFQGAHRDHHHLPCPKWSGHAPLIARKASIARLVTASSKFAPRLQTRRISGCGVNACNSSAVAYQNLVSVSFSSSIGWRTCCRWARLLSICGAVRSFILLR